MASSDNPVPEVGLTKEESEQLKQSGIRVAELNRVKKLRRGKPEPTQWREIMAFFAGQEWKELSPKLRGSVYRYTGVSSQHRRFYGRMANIPEDLFAKLARLRISDGISPGRGNPTDGLSRAKLAIIGQYWPIMKRKWNPKKLEDRILKVAQRAVDERWSETRLKAELAGPDGGDDFKPDILSKRLAALTARLSKLAPADRREGLRKAVAFYRNLDEVTAEQELTAEKRDQLIDCVLRLAGIDSGNEAS